jgi:hypothetical protein
MCVIGSTAGNLKSSYVGSYSNACSHVSRSTDEGNVLSTYLLQATYWIEIEVGLTAHLLKR